MLPEEGTLPEEASIHTAEMTAIKVALKEKKGRRGDSWSYTQTLRAQCRQ